MLLNNNQLEKVNNENEVLYNEVSQWKQETMNLKLTCDEGNKQLKTYKDALKKMDSDRDEAFEIADVQAEIAATATAKLDMLNRELQEMKLQANNGSQQVNIYLSHQLTHLTLTCT